MTFGPASTVNPAKAGLPLLRQSLRSSPVAWVALVAIVPAFWHIGILLSIFGARLRYPMDLEWMEGGQLYHAHRLLHGAPIYGPPSNGFAPFAYPPLHLVALASIGIFTGLNYQVGRLLSIGAFAVACGVVFHVVRTRIDPPLVGWCAATLAVATCAASFPATGGWYDLVRNDSLALAFPVLAAGLAGHLEWLERRAVWIGLALLLVATVYTKQTGVFFAAWIWIFVIASDRRAGLNVGVAALAMGGSLFLALQLVTRGWFVTWIMLLRHQRIHSHGFQVGAVELTRFAPFLVGIPVLAAILLIKRWLSRAGGLWLGMLIVAIPAGILPFVKVGGFLNNLMPIVFLAGPVTIILLADLVSGLRQGTHRFAANLTMALTLAAGAVFLTTRRYDAEAYLPSSVQREQAAGVNTLIGRLSGGVLLPDYPFLAVRNDREVPQLHRQAYVDAGWAGLSVVSLERDVLASPARWLIVDATEEAAVRYWTWFAETKTIDAPPMLVGWPVAPNRLLARLRPRHTRLLFDFEKPLSGWEREGLAFVCSPTGTRNRGQQPIFNAQGAGLVNSYCDETRDHATGRLLSPLFVLDRDYLGLRVGGGAGAGVRVSLVVDGVVMHAASGENSEVLRYVAWDVRAFRGRSAKLEIVDEETGPWGHILCDDVQLFDDELRP